MVRYILALKFHRLCRSFQSNRLYRRFNRRRCRCLLRRHNLCENHINVKCRLLYMAEIEAKIKAVVEVAVTALVDVRKVQIVSSRHQPNVNVLRQLHSQSQQKY